MSGVLRGLACLGEEAKKISRIGRRVDLRETDVAGNDRQNVVQVMGDATRKSAERFELARGEPLGFGLLSFADVSEEDGDPAIARISVHFKPGLAAGVIRLKFHG